jgi:spore coat protein H
LNLIENQRFYGFKKLFLASNYKDDSYLRDKVTGDVFRENGVPTPQRPFWRVMVDTVSGEAIYFGLYSIAEMPQEIMLDEKYENPKGNIYKPDGNRATWVDEVTLNDISFEKKKQRRRS